MCGIVGVVGFRPKNNAFQNALSSILYRGPNGKGIWQNDSHPPVHLGHCRLSIIDTSNAGNQPMQKGNLWITFNGEIYNYLEIRQELQSLGVRFQTGTDTEVLLAAFQRWGPTCVNKLNGMWAFAIWNEDDDKLFLSRDRFGKKPLFYAFESGGLIFGSEMKALAPLMRHFKPSSKFKSLANDQYGYEGSEDCLIEGIYRFPSGSSASISLRDIEKKSFAIHRYWDTRDNLVEIPHRYEEQVERFRELFFDACRIRMRADVPIGTALSGGLDSSSVACAISHISKSSHSRESYTRGWQRAFIASFSGSYLDEKEYAQAVLHKTGIQGELLEIDPSTGLERLPEYQYRFEEIYPTNPIPMMDMYRRISDAGVRVSIDGHGGDELLSGYDGFLNALNDAFGDLAAMKKILTCWGIKNPGIGDVLHKLIELHHGKKGFLKFLWSQINTRKREKLKQKEFGYLNSHLYACFHENILPTLLRNYDRYSMSAGVEIRMPFLDYRLVAFCFSLPWQSKAVNGSPYMKAILRDALNDDLPSTVRYRRDKIGFSSPVGAWLNGPWRGWLLDTLNSRSFLECDLIDSNDVKSMVERLLTGNANHDFSERTWAKLTPFLWQEYFLKRCQATTFA